MLVPSLVLYEWLRGPRLPEELAAQEALFPPESVVPFGGHEAALSARLYRSLRRPRGREVDIAIAACAIHREAALWTGKHRRLRRHSESPASPALSADASPSRPYSWTKCCPARLTPEAGRP